MFLGLLVFVSFFCVFFVFCLLLYCLFVFLFVSIFCVFLYFVRVGGGWVGVEWCVGGCVVGCVSCVVWCVVCGVWEGGGVGWGGGGDGSDW